MNVLWIERDKTKLMQLKQDIQEFVPEVNITVCSDPYKAESLAKEKDFVVSRRYGWESEKREGPADAVFDGLNLDSVMNTI